MRTIHIIGRKNQGKTTLLEALIKDLTQRGFKVGSIKHSSHLHELDTPGKDSHRHRMAGAKPAAIIAQDLAAIYLPLDASEDPYLRLETHFKGCDFVLIESHRDYPGRIKVEVWRDELKQPPLAAADASIAAIITDDPIQLSTPIWPRNDISTLTDRLIELLHRTYD